MSVGGPLGFSLAPYIKKFSGGLYNALKPVSGAYANAMGHRAMGLKYDDLIPEEREDMQRALARLPKAEQYDRVFRMRTAFQQSIQHSNLPRDKWIKPEDDVRYLTPTIETVVKEEDERAEWDSMVVERKR